MKFQGLFDTNNIRIMEEKSAIISKQLVTALSIHAMDMNGHTKDIPLNSKQYRFSILR